MQPFTCLTTISGDQVIKYECSDRIVLSQSYCDELFFKENDLLLLTNSRNQSVCGTLFATHNGSSTFLYAPSWMIYKLDVLDSITVSHLPKKTCTAIQIKPHSTTFKNHPHFMALLNLAIVNYRSLTKGHRIPLSIGSGIEYITIENLLPSTHETCFVFNCGLIDVQVIDSLDSEAPPPSYLYMPHSSSNVPFAFIGRGYPVGGHINNRLTPMQAAAIAARRRVAAFAAGSKTY